MANSRIGLSVFVIVLQLFCRGAFPAGEDQPYLENIRNYIDSVSGYRFDAEFRGKEDRGVADMGTVQFDIVAKYRLLFDKQRNLWKIENDEKKTPLGDFSNDALKRMPLGEKKTISRSSARLCEFMDKEIHGANYFVLHDDPGVRDMSFRYHMQRIDPMSYIRHALPSRKMKLTGLTTDGDLIALTYQLEDVKNAYVVIKLSKQWDYLPVSIENEGPGYAKLKDGTYKDVYCRFTFQRNDVGSPVIAQIDYRNASGSGQITYSAVDYNPKITDDDLQIPVPPDAFVMSGDGKIISMPLERGYDSATLEDMIDDLGIEDIAVADVTQSTIEHIAVADVTQSTSVVPRPEMPATTVAEPVAGSQDRRTGWPALVAVLCIILGLVGFLMLYRGKGRKT